MPGLQPGHGGSSPPGAAMAILPENQTICVMFPIEVIKAMNNKPKEEKEKVNVNDHTIKRSEKRIPVW